MAKMLLQSILLLISTVIGQSIGLPCPSGCTCIQRTVRCIRLHLSKVPLVPSDTTIIDLRYNEIREIPSNAFGGLPSLHTIFLSENQIGLIHEDAFKGLSTLKYLYLNNNRISKISPDAFQGLNQLQSLYLENNDIWELDAKTFSNLPQLGRLFLSRNKITVLPLGVFRNLPSLKRLRLDSNPIECDCSLLSFLRHIRSLKRQPIVVLTCTTPSPLNRRTFVSLREKDFHCKKPKLMDQPRDVQVAVGQTVEMPCSAIGDPVPEVIWMQNSNEIDTYSTSRIQVLNNGSLRIVHATKQDVGMYECMARNSLGEVKSRPVRMTVNNDLHLSRPNFERPRFILAPNDQFVTNSDTIILHCVAAGFPVPQIQWYFNDNSITQSTERVQVLSNGTIVIDEPTESNSGAYKCSARNNLGTSYAVAHVQVNVTTPSTENTTEDDSLVISVELPKIILAPENQTVKSGSTLVLECDAEGDPQPTIIWRRNGTLLATSRSASNRINFDNENTELQIEHVKESDSGQYVCIAENENGRIEASADVIVENARGPPRLLFEPYDMEVLPGTTIEIPCKGEGDPAPQVKWRKDGNTITANTDRLRITPVGSLYISNITQADAGRYECSVTNQFGRAMANGLLTIRKPEIITPGDKYVRIAYEEASREIDQAINHTIDYLFSNRSNDMAHNYGELFRLFRYPNSPERQLARAAEIYERTLVNIRKHVDAGANLTAKRDNYEYQELLSPEHLNLVAELSGCMTSRRMPNCTDMCFHSKYRSVDGTCNNLNNPMWGSSLTAFRRLVKPIYENGFSMPVGWTKGKLYHGFPKPSARLVSTTLISTKEITPDDEITHMVMQWGQFLDHDLDHAIPSVSSESWDGIDCKKSCDYAAPCYPIEVPPNDPRIRNRRCIDLVRSSAICGSGMTSVFFEAVQPREQINQLTSFIDASQVYGYSEEFARELRNLSTDDGRLRTGVHFPNQKDMLPFAAPQDGIDCRRNVEESSINCFVAGDIRVNEQVGLLAMHVIWMREHNRIADKLKFLNPHWDGDLTYEEARKVVGAQMQHITYKHWLPKILGHEGMHMLGEYQGYNPNLNPSISNEFATAALRFGHSLINPILHRLDTNYQPISQGHLQLHKAFFSPWRLVHEGGVDPLMRGMFSVPAKLKMPSQNLNTELTEKLFHTAHAVALDLAAINIQRGRDHAIPGYNEYRQLCNMTVAERFDDLRHEISSIEIRNKLKELYGHPSNIDIWVGGILEDQVPGGKVGPLFRCILVDQFKRLRDGDRFYYENPSVFLPEQLREIKQASLGRIMCDNGDNITEVTDDLFILPTHQGGYKKCYDIPGINMYFWQDCGSCGSTLPPIFDSYVPSTYKKPTTTSQRSSQTLSPPQRSKRSLPESDVSQNYTINEIHDDDLIDMHEERVEGLEELINIFQKELKKLKKRVKKLEQQCNQNNNKHQHHHCQDSSGNRRLNNEIWNQDECTKCQCKHPQVTCITEKCGPIVCPNNAQPVKSPDECCPTCPPPIPVVTTRETEITTGSFGYEAGTAATGA